MPTAQLRCPDCATSWPARAARFCGRCGQALRPPARRREGSGRLPRWVTWALPAAAAIALVATGSLLVGGGPSVEAPGSAASEQQEVEVPEPLGGPAELTDEQRAALEGFDPDRIRCEPHGCASWRWMLDGDIELVTADHGWLAVLEGSTLRVRSTDGLAAPSTDPTSSSTGPETSHAERGTTPQRSTADRVGGGSSWDPGPTREDLQGADHDLATIVADLDPSEVHTAQAPDELDLADVAAGPPFQVRALADGAVIVGWAELALHLDLDGEVIWARHDAEQPLRRLDIEDDHLVVFRDEAPWPHGTSGPGPSPAPIIAAGHDLTTGEELWRRSSRNQLGVVAGGVLIEEGNGDLQLVAAADGHVRWTATGAPHQHVQAVQDPWIVASVGRGTVLVDATTGEERLSLDGHALLSALQPAGGPAPLSTLQPDEDLWLGVWIEQPSQGLSLTAAVVAIDRDGQERWRRPVASPNSGRCCTAAVPWGDGAVALYDPGNHPAPWLLLDAGSGQPLGSSEENHLALPLPTSDDQVVSVPRQPGDRLVQQQQGALGVLHPDGLARISGNERLHVVATEPMIVRQGSELVGIEPVATDAHPRGNRLPRPLR